jgi:hypothetical protein
MSLSDLFNSRHSYRILAFVGRSTATAANGPRLPICVNEWRQQPPTQSHDQVVSGRRSISALARAPGAAAGSLGTLAAPPAAAATIRKPSGSVGALAAGRDAHADLAGWGDAPGGADRPATQIGDRAAANHHPEPVGWVARSARRGDEHAPGAVERCRVCGRGRRNAYNSKGRRHKDGADGMADHRDPRVGVILASWRLHPDRGRPVVIAVPFLQRRQSDGWTQVTTRTEWLAEGVRGMKRICPSPCGDDMGNGRTPFKTMLMYAITASLDAGYADGPIR